MFALKGAGGLVWWWGKHLPAFVFPRRPLIISNNFYISEI